MLTEDILKIVSQSQKIVLYHHERIDGDSLACSYGLLLALKIAYPKKEIKWVADMGYIKKNFSFLHVDFHDTIDPKLIDQTWLAIIGDTCTIKRIYKGFSYLRAKQKICFDHHRNDIDHQVAVFWHEPDLPAAAIQAWAIIKALQIKVTTQIALLIWHGIITDTGFFQFSFAKAAPLQTCLELQAFLNDHILSDLYYEMQQRTKNDLNFQGFVLQNFHKRDSLAYMVVTEAIQKRFHLSPDKCAKVNYLSAIHGVQCWIFFIEYPSFVRVEFRSYGLKVNLIAASFGGGGHERAAGCSLKSLNQTKDVIKLTMQKIKELKAQT